LPPICGDQFAVGFGKFFGGQHGLRAPPEEFGPVGAEVGRQPIETSDEIIIELNEDLATRHDHMLSNMVSRGSPGQRAPHVAVH
jgi:hypothetical protein